MTKAILITAFMMLSVNLYAASSPLASSILKSLQHKSSAATSGESYPMVYGGQDISKPLVATADQSLWSGHSNLVV